MGAANAVDTAFLPDFNTRVAVPAAEAGSAFHPVEDFEALPGICGVKHTRTVGLDNTVTMDALRFQLLPGPRSISSAGAMVEVQEWWDGSWVVTYQQTVIRSRSSPPDARQLRTPVRSAPDTVRDPLVEEWRKTASSRTQPSLETRLSDHGGEGVTHSRDYYRDIIAEHQQTH